MQDATGAATARPRSSSPSRLDHERLRRSTFWTLLVGYGAYYLCRANLGVAAPLLQSEFHLDKTQIGRVSGVATLAYAAGKFTLGPTADLLGGKRVFLLGLAASVAANFAFGASTGLTVFIVIWCVNRLAQSAGWMGLVQLAGGWYEATEYGVVMALLSLSFLVGDVAARGFGSALLALGFGWRALFFAPALVCGAFVLIALRTLVSPPPRVPALRGDAPPAGGDAVEAEAPVRLLTIALVLAKSWGFWLSCVLSFLLTFLRTVFLDWTVVFLVESGTSTWKAGLQSAVFPLTGIAGTLFAGWYSDKRSGTRRGPVAAAMLGLMSLSLLALALWGTASPILALAMIGIAGFLMLGPYSMLGGCMALDFGGQRAAATAAGVNDGVGYLGGSASGLLLAGLVQAQGWTAGFLVLAGAGAVSFAVAVVFAMTGERASK